MFYYAWMTHQSFLKYILPAGTMMKLEIGCGKNIMEGYFGMDIHQYEGVDLVQDVTLAPWEIDDSSCTAIYEIRSSSIYPI